MKSSQLRPDQQTPETTQIELYSYGRSFGKPDGPWTRTWNCEKFENPPTRLRTKHTGLHKRLRREALAHNDAKKMVRQAEQAVLDACSAQNEMQTLRFAFGCTVGRHRSVSIVEELAQVLRTQHRLDVRVVHRDIHRNQGNGQHTHDGEVSMPYLILNLMSLVMSKGLVHLTA